MPCVLCAAQVDRCKCMVAKFLVGTLWITGTVAQDAFVNCSAPQAILDNGSAFIACEEGSEIEHSNICTPSCEVGHKPSIEGNLLCNNGTFVPQNFSCQPCGLSGWMWYRFWPTRVRNLDPTMGFHISELALRYKGVAVSLKRAKVTLQVNGKIDTNSYAGSSGPQNAVDGNTQTIWATPDGQETALIIKFECPTLFDQYAFFTADKDPRRDPIEWRLDGSSDQGLSWAALSDFQMLGRASSPTPYQRQSLTYPWIRVPECFLKTSLNNQQICMDNSELTALGLWHAPRA